MKKYSYLFLFFLLALAIPVNGQKKEKDRKAEAAYNAGEYFKAIDLYKDAYNKVNDKDKKTEIIFMIGECYRITGDSHQAEMWYKKAVQKDVNPR